MLKQKNLPNYKNLKMIHIDVGELEPYGHPKTIHAIKIFKLF